MSSLTSGARAQAGGSVSVSALDVAHTQDFNTLASTGTSSTLPAGWSFSESGTNANTLYRAGIGSDNAGDTYSDDIDVGFLVKSARVLVSAITQEGKGLRYLDPTGRRTTSSRM